MTIVCTGGWSTFLQHPKKVLQEDGLEETHGMCEQCKLLTDAEIRYAQGYITEEDLKQYAAYVTGLPIDSGRD